MSFLIFTFIFKAHLIVFSVIMEQKETIIPEVSNLASPIADLENSTYSEIANKSDIKTILQNQRSRILTINILPFSKGKNELQSITVYASKKSP